MIGEGFSHDEFTTEFLLGRQDLVRSSGNSGSGSSGAGGTGDNGAGKVYTRKQIDGMTPAQYQKVKDANGGQLPQVK